MTEIGIGSIVRSECGYGEGEYFCVVGASGEYALIADGIKRKIASPKKKNVGHLTVFKEKIDAAVLTDGDVAARLEKFNQEKNRRVQ